jgi:hypothetical protein
VPLYAVGCFSDDEPEKIFHFRIVESFSVTDIDPLWALAKLDPVFVDNISLQQKRVASRHERNLAIYVVGRKRFPKFGDLLFQKILIFNKRNPLNVFKMNTSPHHPR